MVAFIEKEVEVEESKDTDDLVQDWKKLPRVVFKVMNANTYLFTSLIEMSQITEPNIFLNHNLYIVYKLIYQCVFKSSFMTSDEFHEKRFASLSRDSPKLVNSCMIMVKEKVQEL